MKTASVAQIRALVEPTVARLGFDLVAVEWVTDSRGPILRLSIDKVGGISADHCARVSHHVSQALDAADPIEAAYILEVSSPGIDRPVQRLADFAKFAGFRAKVRLVEGSPRRRFAGQLLGVEGELVRIQVDDQEHKFSVHAVERANLVLDLNEFQRIAELTGAAAQTESVHDQQ